MADYESFPLWLRSADGTCNVDPTTLPISTELAHSLLRWADDYDATLNRSDPAASGFPSAAAEQNFCEEGAQLARALAAELGARYVIEYFDNRTLQTVVVI